MDESISRERRDYPLAARWLIPFISIGIAFVANHALPNGLFSTPLVQFIVPSVLGAWFIQKRKDVEPLAISCRNVAHWYRRC